MKRPPSTYTPRAQDGAPFDNGPDDEPVAADQEEARRKLERKAES